MRSSGVSEDDRRDRCNYAPGSQVMNTTYDFVGDVGPLASNSITGARKPTINVFYRLSTQHADLELMVRIGERHRTSGTTLPGIESKSL